jgi:plasmid stability protein
MADILIRNVPRRTLQIAKRLAKRRHRSVQEEIRGILVDVFNVGEGAWARRAGRIRERLARSGKTFSDSVTLLREDRAR